MAESSGKLCTAIVLLCVVVPILVGYVMPQDYDTLTGYETEKTSDISSGLNNADVPAWDDYTGLRNNQFLFMGTGMYLADTVESTTSVGNWALVETTAAYPPQNMSVSPSTENLVYQIAAFVSALGQAAEVNDGDKIGMGLATMTGNNKFVYNGVQYESMFVLPGTIQTDKNVAGYMVFLYDDQMQNPVVNVTNEKVTVLEEGTISVTGYKQRVDSQDRPLYADTASGIDPFQRGTSAFWANGYDNQSLEMLISLGGTTAIEMMVGGNTFTISVNSEGMVVIQDHTDGKPITTAILGSKTAYPYILLSLDSISDTIVFTGLSGMESFADSYQDKMGNSVTLDMDLDPINTITFVRSTGDGFAYLVRNAVVQYGTIHAMQDATLTPSDYLPDNLWVVGFRSIAVYGDSITITDVAGGQTVLQVKDGRIQPNESLGLTEEIPMMGLVIQRIPDSSGAIRTSINGVSLPINIQSITFDGTWVMSVSLADVDSYEYKDYSWNAGGFGLTAEGFCSVGIITAFLSFIGISLYGQRSGTRMGLALFVSAIIGLVYLIFASAV